MLAVADLHKEYLAPSGPLPVLNGVSLSVDAGESIAVMGPSGSGKSTLLQILGVLDEPTSGEVTIAGSNPFNLDLAGQARFRNSNIGFVFQDHCLLPQLTVLENVLVPILAGDPDPGAEARARDLLEEVGLSGRLDHKPAELSGGEKQRTAIARALIREPRLLLCDEPTGNLDRQSAEQVAVCLESACARHAAALVVVTHSVELAARFGRRLHLRDGLLLDESAS